MALVIEKHNQLYNVNVVLIIVQIYSIQGTGTPPPPPIHTLKNQFTRADKTEQLYSLQ